MENVSGDSGVTGDVEPYRNFQERYPPKPVRPRDSDCCGSGCSTCVFDLYDLDVKRWQTRCEEIDNGLESSSLESTAASALSIYEYTSLEISNVVDLSSTLKLFTFKIPGCGRIRMSSGQHLVARCILNGQTIIRPYTPVSKATQHGSFVVAIKLYPTGLMSKCIEDMWKIGACVDWRGPFGDFRYKANELSRNHQFSDMLLIAGGTGITPMIQIIREILDNEDDYVKVNLWYSVHSAEELILKEEFDEWKSYWNFNVKYFFTDEDIKDYDGYRKKYMKYGDLVHFGRISKNDFVEVSDRIHLQNEEERIKILICGTRSFNRNMCDIAHTVFNVGDKNVVLFE